MGFNKAKAIQDLASSLRLLTTSVKQANQGNIDTYRIVSVELRKLLCDGPNSLLPRVFPEVRLLPLRSSIEDAEFKERFGWSLTEHSAIRVPGNVTFDDKGATVSNLFDKNADPVPLDEWLSQPFLNQDITLRCFIRSISDKEGAHSDSDYNSTLKTTKSVKLGRSESHPKLIAAIGDYVSKLIASLLVKESNLYFEAVEFAKRGEKDKALVNLKKVINTNPYYKQKILSDEAFKNFLNDKSFNDLFR